MTRYNAYINIVYLLLFSLREINLSVSCDNTLASLLFWNKCARAIQKFVVMVNLENYLFRDGVNQSDEDVLLLSYS